jgi:ABC-type sugar transport system substrate-binding protein
MKKFLVVVIILLCITTTMVFAQSQGKKADSGLGTAYLLSKQGSSYEPPITVKISKKWKIGVVLPHLANPHFVGQAYGYADEAKKLGVECIIYEAGGYTHLDTQLSQVEDLISMPVDALILVAINPAGSIPMVEKAIAAGIPVINCNVMTASEKVVSRVRCDDTIIGEMLAKYMVEQVNGKGNFLIIAGVAGSSWADGRAKGFRDYIKNNAPGIKILDTRYIANNDPALGLAEMEDLLQTYHDIQGVMTGSAVLGMGVAQAIDAAGKSKDIVVTGVDIFDESVNGLKDGRMDAVILQDTVAIGRWGVKAAVAVLEGKAAQLSKNFWVPVHIVTKDNVNTFNFAGTANPPAGWKLR